MPWLLAISLIGVVLLIAGLRGRRIDDHPWCRACGFDLFGAPADRARCPECGAALGRSRAVRIGQRRRLRSLIAAGALLALFALAPLGVLLYSGVSGKDLSPYKPTWWLIADIQRSPPMETSPQFAELTRRLIAGEIPGDRVRQVVDRILDVQGDPAQTWLAAWGDFVEAAELRGQVPPGHWTTYLEQIPVMKVRVRDRLRLGDPLSIHTAEEFRCGANFGELFRLT